MTRHEHPSRGKAGQIAPRILLPGDPRRARWIAEHFLDGAELYSEVRGMLGFTGTFAGIPVSVQGTGMGQPSLGIYAHELFAEYGVTHAVRVGTCGSLQPHVGVRDVVIAMAASTDSAMNTRRFPATTYAPSADWALLARAVDAAQRRGVSTHVGGIFSSDTFYGDDLLVLEALAAHGVLAVEMETAMLYTLAARHGVRALTVCTASDHVFSGEQTTADEREQSFADAVHVALDAITSV
jgi:purine-nucleoside phosphorylase